DLDLGGAHANLTAMGPNHTAGDTVIWVDADRVLFSGDLAMRAQPAFASPHSSLKRWMASLDQLEALKPAIIVPSHGPTGDGIGFIAGYRTYLTEVRERTTAEKRAGHSVDEAVTTVTAAFGDRAPDKARLAGASRTVSGGATWGGRPAYHVSWTFVSPAFARPGMELPCARRVALHVGKRHADPAVSARPGVRSGFDPDHGRCV